MAEENRQKGLKMKANSPSNLRKMIEMTKSSLERSKPRSQRRVELELQLRDLVTKQLRTEMRQERRKAA